MRPLVLPKRRKKRRKPEQAPTPNAQKPPECCKRYQAGQSCSCWSCQNNVMIGDELGRAILEAYGHRKQPQPKTPIYRDGVQLSRRIRHA
jgi:hypothetical protein